MLLGAGHTAGNNESPRVAGVLFILSKGNYLSDYCVGKDAIVSFVQALGTKLAGGIRVNSISPG